MIYAIPSSPYNQYLVCGDSESYPPGRGRGRGGGRRGRGRGNMIFMPYINIKLLDSSIIGSVGASHRFCIELPSQHTHTPVVTT